MNRVEGNYTDSYYNSTVQKQQENVTSKKESRQYEKDSPKMFSEDGISISESARNLAETARNKAAEFRAMHFSSIHGEIKEIPAEYRCENLFKLELKATSVSGGKSIFEGHAEEQSKVFEKWIDENAAEYMSEKDIQELKKKVSAIASGMDNLNSREGYRGTSFESVFLLSASEAGLNKVNEMFLPKQLQDEFSGMIGEYVHFNSSARNSIMERMTPDYMVVGIGAKQESYKYKAEIVSDERTFYQKEQAEVSKLCRQVLGEQDSNTNYSEIEKYLRGYYENRDALKKQPDMVQEKVTNMMVALHKMYDKLG